ncbi:ribosome silencing factor [Allofrancisella guangzhouensis]|uniref:Ribosomal silencing factor RsfS n=1 Tax=Allofrancisella guangzhouensis TaxID=594679 RepID=A0A0A8EBP9_9GAMM|nr:ribosome silencing factor [Allofrancisella guangzhouensis]AJC49556.1 ribosomal silencing factor RsfS [Allofrancisella guangzhouensis]MBK2027469.1 ribosome silencing factor [Allofrancisella guangzhouensis]MBK2044128.1 ribosome silencing factor [Allofrancisella guangzhouensis]MBK2045443.1 ribosome silencing factor [Allofrancisella guangzhouensis]
MTTDQRLDITIEALDDLKGINIQTIGVEHLTDMMDKIIICTASSTTHARALAKHLEHELKKNTITILGIEGDNKADWVLVDIGDIVVHIMLEETRNLYALEKLWDIKRKDS